MKNLILILASSFVTTLSAQVKTTVNDGNFFALSTWDCFCIPLNGDTLVIEHTVTMTTGIPYSAGSITINAGGQLTDDGTDKDIYINGGEFYNYGTLNCDGFWLDSGYVYNEGTMNLDSLWTQDDMNNIGLINTFDFFNDESAHFYSNNDITVNHNFANAGVFNLDGAFMLIDNNLSNCNITSSDATLDVNGMICVANDFINCGTDTLRGTGHLYIAGASTNSGEVEGNITIGTPTGGFTLNTGNIAPSVSFVSNGCELATKKIEKNYKVYPNPNNGIFILQDYSGVYSIYSISGKLIQKGNTPNGAIQMEGNITPGIYFIEINANESIARIKIQVL